jgi:hypothetical protein
MRTLWCIVSSPHPICRSWFSPFIPTAKERTGTNTNVIMTMSFSSYAIWFNEQCWKNLVTVWINSKLLRLLVLTQWTGHMYQDEACATHPNSRLSTPMSSQVTSCSILLFTWFHKSKMSKKTFSYFMGQSDSLAMTPPSWQSVPLSCTIPHVELRDEHPLAS